MLQQGTVNYMC